MAARSDLTRPDKSIQELCDKIRPSLEEQLGRSFSEYKAACYWSEAEPEDNRMGYGIKIYVGDEYVHVYVTKDPDGELWLENFEAGHTSSDTIR